MHLCNDLHENIVVLRSQITLQFDLCCFLIVKLTLRSQEDTADLIGVLQKVYFPPIILVTAYMQSYLLKSY